MDYFLQMRTVHHDDLSFKNGPAIF